MKYTELVKELLLAKGDYIKTGNKVSHDYILQLIVEIKRIEYSIAVRTTPGGNYNGRR
jgi:hypothetical protein